MRNLIFALLFSTLSNAYTIYLNDSIKEGTLKNLEKEYYSLTNTSDITLSIDSTGGLMYEMYNIMDFVKQKNIKTHCELKCYSAAGLIFLSGKVKTMDKNAKIMVHEYNFTMNNGRYTVSDLILKVQQEQYTYEKYILTISELLKIPFEEVMPKIVQKEWYIDYKEAKKLKIIK